MAAFTFTKTLVTACVRMSPSCKEITLQASPADSDNMDVNHKAQIVIKISAFGPCSISLYCTWNSQREDIFGHVQTLRCFILFFTVFSKFYYARFVVVGNISSFISVKYPFLFFTPSNSTLFLECARCKISKILFLW